MAIYRPTGAVAAAMPRAEPLLVPAAEEEKEPPLGPGFGVPARPLMKEKEEEEELLFAELAPEEATAVAAGMNIEPEKVAALEAAFLGPPALMPEQPNPRAMAASVEDAVAEAVRGAVVALASVYPLALQMAQSEDGETTRRLVLEMPLFVPVPPDVCVTPLAKARRAGTELGNASERTDYFIEMLLRMAPLRPSAAIFREERAEYENIAVELEAVGLASLADAMRVWLWNAVPEPERKLPKLRRPEAAPATESREPQAWLDAGTRTLATEAHKKIWEAIAAQSASQPRTAGEAEAKIQRAFSSLRDQAPLFMAVAADMNRFVLLASQVEGADGDARVREAVSKLEFLTPTPSAENSEAALACAVEVARELSLEQRVHYYLDDVLPKIAPFTPLEMEMIVMRFDGAAPYLAMAQDFAAVGGDEMTRLADSLSHWLRTSA